MARGLSNGSTLVLYTPGFIQLAQGHIHGAHAIPATRFHGAASLITGLQIKFRIAGRDHQLKCQAPVPPFFGNSRCGGFNKLDASRPMPGPVGGDENIDDAVDRLNRIIAVQLASTRPVSAVVSTAEMVSKRAFARKIIRVLTENEFESGGKIGVRIQLSLVDHRQSDSWAYSTGSLMISSAFARLIDAVDQAGKRGALPEPVVRPQATVPGCRAHSNTLGGSPRALASGWIGLHERHGCSALLKIGIDPKTASIVDREREINLP